MADNEHLFTKTKKIQDHKVKVCAPGLLMPGVLFHLIFKNIFIIKASGITFPTDGSQDHFIYKDDDDEDNNDNSSDPD